MTAVVMGHCHSLPSTAAVAVCCAERERDSTAHAAGGCSGASTPCAPVPWGWAHRAGHRCCCTHNVWRTLISVHNIPLLMPTPTSPQPSCLAAICCGCPPPHPISTPVGTSCKRPSHCINAAPPPRQRAGSRHRAAAAGSCCQEQPHCVHGCRTAPVENAASTTQSTRAAAQHAGNCRHRWRAGLPAQDPCLAAGAPRPGAARPAALAARPAAGALGTRSTACPRQLGGTARCPAGGAAAGGATAWACIWGPANGQRQRWGRRFPAATDTCMVLASTV